jgi:hypothetical protein
LKGEWALRNAMNLDIASAGINNFKKKAIDRLGTTDET